MQGGEGDVQCIARLADGADDIAHGALEILNIAVVRRDDLFPVPLVNVNGVQVVDLFVTSDGVHIGEEALADVELVALEGKTLPLGQRLHDLGVGADIGDIEGNRTLDAV